ncbi:hypothetical protein B0O80DRAFT_500096 [Mortierella sp. GBAus27b]|nr:hypothetical protein BGX31_008895 [Mortierella sp. GBA43]KAI8351741.1 hypothetical protein B0O80DRAFT_500096 [Mortierella sp. GBAus27b]
MSAINTAARSVRAPLQAIARRQYSSTVANAAAGSTSTSAAASVGHSNQRLAVAAGVSFVAGVDVTYAYYNFFQKKEPSA